MGSVDVEVSTHTDNSELLQSALLAAQDAYTKVHCASKESHDEACKYMPGGNTRTVLHTSPFPLTVQSAQSCYLKTIDEREYVDFLGEYTAGIYGHNSPLIRAAVESALDDGWNYGAHSQAEQLLAKHICTRFPSIELVRFVNSGSEANMLALATAIVLAKQHGEHKRKILLFEKGYHGSTMSGRADLSKPTLNLPHDFVVAQYNDTNDVKKMVSSLPPGSLAAILVEPMLGSGGCFSGSHEFLRSLRDIADQHQALLIFDEVMTSRLSYHGFHTTYGIIPDLVTLGKYLGGGMSFGAFGGKKTIMDLFDPRKAQLEHPGTFNNNVFTMHAGLAGATILTPERLNELNERGDSMRLAVEEVLKKSGILQEGVVPMAPVTNIAFHERAHSKHPPKMFIKGVGSLMCIHFAGPGRELLQGLFWHHMLDQGIYMAQRGFIALSLEITEAHIQKFVSAVTSFIRQWDVVLRW